jgi:DNA polymerase I-like protein with 3'-5' exonuclease and polymerase domains
MIDYFASGKDIYTEAAMAYYVGFLKQNKDYATIRKLYRNPFKLGVISTIYTAGDGTLAEAFDCQMHEVREIKNAIFKQFQELYNWQQNQIAWNKANRGYIKTFLGDIRKTYEEYSKQTRQSINADVQGTCSLVATAGFNNIISSALKKKMFLNPAVIVHRVLCT